MESLTVKEAGMLFLKLGFILLVHLVAKKGMAGVGHVNSDLVGSAGLKPQGKIAYSAVSSQHLIVGDRLTCGVVAIKQNSLLLTVYGMAANRIVHRAKVILESTADQRAILTLDAMIF